LWSSWEDIVAPPLGGSRRKTEGTEKQSGTSAARLIPLKSNGDTIGELRMQKGTTFSIAAKKAHYDMESERQTAKADVTIQIGHAGGSAVVVKADEIEAVIDGQ